MQYVYVYRLMLGNVLMTLVNRSPTCTRTGTPRLVLRTWLLHIAFPTDC